MFPYLEHERVGPRVEPRVGENGLDGVVGAEDDGRFGADLEREHVAVLPTQLGEGAAEVEDVQEREVAEDGDADRPRRQQGARNLVAIVSPVIVSCKFTSGVTRGWTKKILPCLIK